MKKKKMLLIFVAILLIIPLVGCAAEDTAAPPAAPPDAATPDTDPQPAPEPAPEPGEDFIIAFDMWTNQCPYCLMFANYIEYFAVQEGITAIITQADGDQMRQIANFESVLVQGAQVISGIFGDMYASLPIVDLARQHDATIVATLTSIADRGDGYEKYIYLGSENYDGGFLQGQWLAENLPQNAGIWYLGMSPTDQQGIDRLNGMLDALAAAGRDDVQIVASENTDNMMDRGVEVMETWLQAFPTIDAVVGSADVQIIGAIEVAKAAGRMDDIIWVGFDGQDMALESILAGEMSMTIFQDAQTQARALVDLFVRIRAGSDPTQEADILIPFRVITYDNVRDFIG
ncbi:MAG: sugar ABC transporter substrate-binding protein [Oscillospiraceae bacterium]|nr:sugar ABC transporter substrate-binding protein [Oscillospiraceae bacterium]MCL2278371.1 sugar ABC transporter substrate-binding protein [Oscillospiraceae bacterium]